LKKVNGKKQHPFCCEDWMKNSGDTDVPDVFFWCKHAIASLIWLHRGKRKVQMDKNLRTWLIEADGTKKEISCREICETFNDGSIITRLRAGIDSGADVSTILLDD
jgi:hypothetical protein